MIETLISYTSQIIDPFFNPSKRVFVGYLASAVLIAFAVQLYQSRRRGYAGPRFFAKEIWLSRSARADYRILFINQILMMGAAPRLLSKLLVATLLFEYLHLWMDGRPALAPDAPIWFIAFVFTLALFLLDDVSKYGLHRLMHRWSVLWAFHEVHHSAETLTPLTVYRTHPVEGILFALRSALVQGTVVAVFVFFFGSRADLVTILGANVFLFFFNLAGANLRHSHIWISYGPTIEKWLISPAQHQIHHSVEERHFDRNFGAVLAIWDWMGGSLCLAKNNKPAAFGVGPTQVDPHSLRGVYWSPIRKSVTSGFASINQGSQAMIRALSTRIALRSLLGFGVIAVGLFFAQSVVARELNIYSHRQPFLIEPFLDAYEKETGTIINVVYASKGLAQRLLAEGENSPADVVLTVDIARLHVYADKDLLAQTNSEKLMKAVPEHLRDPQNRWFAFSKRARVLAVFKEIDDIDQLKRYEDLADPRWKGRICSRPGSHVYNRALVASIIHASGKDKALAWAQGVLDNLARRPQGNDRAQVKAIYQGVCDVAIINNYYYVKLKSSNNPDHKAWAENVTLVFPNQEDRGSHVNISGGGVAKHAKNKQEAVRFLEFLTAKKSQELYGTVNFEYPIRKDVALSPELELLGAFKEDTMPISRIAELAKEAQKIIDRVGW